MSLRCLSVFLAVLCAPQVLAAQRGLTEVPSSGEARQGLIGVYAIRSGPDDPGVSLRVFLSGDSLMGQMDGNAPTRLVHEEGNAFHPAAAPEFRLEFVVIDGTAQSVSIRSPQGTMAGTRTDEASMDPSRSGALFNELVRMDSVLFDASYVACDTARINALLTQDVEFYHDRTGLHAGDQVRDDFARLAASCPAKQGVRRELVPGTMRVYPIEDFGVVQTGVHRFVEQGNPVGTVAQFINLWQRTPGGWMLRRVVSFDHRESYP